MYSRRNEAREERMRQKVDAGLMSERFPKVSSIVITMKYLKDGKEVLLRTLNYNPHTHAFFTVSCLGEGCTNGGLDMTGPITRMIRGRKKLAKGKLSCSGGDADAVHADISYDVRIEYA